MKKTMMKSILSTILITSLIVTPAYAACPDNEANVTHLAKFVHSVEQHIAHFFDSSKKTPYNTCVIELDKAFQEIKRAIDTTTRGVGDALNKEINEVIDYALKHFTIAYNIIKKYNGKPSTEAAAFATEIKRDFNTEKVFGELITKLKLLKCKACHAGETNLVKKLDTIIAMIEKKRKEWVAKADWVLFAGLKVRMDCK